MAVTSRVFCANGLLCIFKLSRVPSFPCHSFEIRHGDKDDEIILHEYAVSFGFTGPDSELLNIVDKLTMEVKVQ